MSDRLPALRQRVELHARVIHSGTVCGSVDFYGGAEAGHLHLLRPGPLRMTEPQGRRNSVDEPSVVFIPRSGAHRLDGGESPGADVVCASIDFGVGDDNPLLRAAGEGHECAACRLAQAWNVASRAELAGMSRARFAAHFKRTVGVPPGDDVTAAV